MRLPAWATSISTKLRQSQPPRQAGGRPRAGGPRIP